MLILLFIVLLSRNAWTCINLKLKLIENLTPKNLQQLVFFASCLKGFFEKILMACHVLWLYLASQSIESWDQSCFLGCDYLIGKLNWNLHGWKVSVGLGVYDKNIDQITRIPCKFPSIHKKKPHLLTTHINYNFIALFMNPKKYEKFWFFHLTAIQADNEKLVLVLFLDNTFTIYDESKLLEFPNW
jgi:hypothetical protein